MNDLQLLNPIEIVQSRHQRVATLGAVRLLRGFALVLVREDGVHLIQEERHSSIGKQSLRIVSH